MNLNRELAKAHSGRGNHRAAQMANARAMKKVKAPASTVVDPLDPPAFLLRKNDTKTVAKEWDRFLADRTPVQTQASAKVNWLKPRSLSDEEFEHFTALRDAKKVAKLETFKARMTTRVDPKGKRWDARHNRWVDDKTGAPAKPIHEEVKAVRQAAKAATQERKAQAAAAKAQRAAVPTTGILAEFVCRPDTNRARLLVTFEKSLGKMIAGEKLSQAVYGTTDKLGPLVMVIKGAKDTITKLKLPYKLHDKDGAAWGLFPLKATAKKGKGK